MKCIEVQSNIIAYIDDKLEKEEKINFLNHVKSCANCREEVDIYYTMIEGMRQLDGNIPLSKDFSKELDDRMDRELKISRQKKGFLRSSFLLLILGLLGVGIFVYVNFLNLLYEDEQNEIKEAQGEYYFSDTFSPMLFETEESRYLLNINVEKEETPPTYYERVRDYKVLK